MHRFLTLALLVLVAPVSAAGEAVDFVRDVQPIFQKHCYACHAQEKQKSGLRLDIRSQAFKGGDVFGASIVPGKAEKSPLIQAVLGVDDVERMPPKGKGLSEQEIKTLTKWVADGAVWPEGADAAKVEDRKDHWSFKPVATHAVPQLDEDRWSRHAIDRFILAALRAKKLQPSAEADRATWIRRVSLDLTGLPPTPEQVQAFLADQREGAFERVVDVLLASPRYGERWAQHWLDVVRYADTHGFEVNTERPNAWPYRDYVIEAFNRGTPYDQFIREQITGDQLGKDAATGFLVTASVLLPGQIGADDVSKRLARQDAIDEVVVNVSQTFLGLTVGCARCHDHKFDPISHADYFAMQAFVAGVEYEERPLRDKQSEERRQQLQQATARLAAIDRQLAQFSPLAQVGYRKPKPTDAKGNEETFPAQTARFVKFTIDEANAHPTLGVIEPCMDEIEIFTDEAMPRNVALASHGTKVTASGSRASASHQLAFINDGKLGNDRSWMGDEHGRGWVMFELPQATRINKIVWSRDRTGRFTDRLATAYTIEAGPSADQMKTIVRVASPRPTVNARMNVDRFEAIEAYRLRFTIANTNEASRLEPVIDELEVFSTTGENIALSSAGTLATSTGDNIVFNRHELRFINDGHYGNSRSWMSNKAGAGSVVLEFDKPHKIDRVIWGRDREGKFTDRLPLDYRIEVADAAGNWHLVADAGDRDSFAPGKTPSSAMNLAGLSEEDALKANRLLEERKQTQQKIAESSKELVVFAGKFRKPDDIHRLRRGDPEQPQEKVAPAVPSIFGEASLPLESTETQRRKALADWIASPQNPMTARVMVNRIWQGHFGIGLVTTSNDFGRNGVKPTHPELLDWLATEFIRSGWSIKHMHRLIVLSATYRQAAHSSASGEAIDADVQYLWRFPTRRLEGEAIRDSMLAVSGRLNLKMGGPGYNLFDLRGGLSGFNPVESFKEDGLRRLIYAHKVRRERDAVFGAFDCPDGGQSTDRRRESTTPIQALNLFNSRFTLDESDALAVRVKQQAGDDLDKQIHSVWQLALNREPTADELRDAQLVVREHGLATLCRVIFNTNEFLFLP